MLCKLNLKFLIYGFLLFCSITPISTLRGFAEESSKINLTQELNLDRDSRNNILANDLDYKTSHKKVWVAGDMRRGQSLVVWAIREGRQCAHEVDKALMGSSVLPK